MAITVTDYCGDAWDVTEARSTPHGFDVLLGYPSGLPRGRGGTGGKRVILTPELAQHLERFRERPSLSGLPVGFGVIKRLRKLLGHHRYLDRRAWWEERVDDLADLTLEAFAERHRVSVAAAANARLALFGPRLRPAGWWRAPDVAEIILSDRPRSEIAEALGLSVGSVGRLRYVLKHGSQ